MLRKLFPSHKLIRTRDPKVIAQADVVWDVGYVYDPKLNRFDHHQEGCDERFEPTSKIPMSSMGMIYKSFGRDFIQSFYSTKLKEDFMDKLFKSFYYQVLIDIDALDNGISPHTCDQKDLYYMRTGITAVVTGMNELDPTSEDQFEKFEEAADYVGLVLRLRLDSIYQKLKRMEKDQKIFSEAVLKMRPKTGLLIVDKFCPNLQSCITSHNKSNSEPLISYAIYQSDDTWKVRVIGRGFSYEKLLTPIPESDSEIMKDFVFMHKKMFICGFKTKEGAMMYANKYLI